MLRTELLLLLPLVVAVTVGQANRGYSYYGTSNVRDQRPQLLYGQRPLPLPERPMPVTGPVTAAPEAPAAPAPILDEPSAPAIPPAPADPSYTPVLPPRPLYTPNYRPLLSPRQIRPALSSIAPPQTAAIGEPQPLVTELPLQPVEANTPEVPILPEPVVEQPEPVLIPYLAAQPGESVGEPAPVSEQSPAPESIQTSAVVSESIPQPEPIRQPEPIPQPQPIRQPEPVLQPESIRQPEPIPQPIPIRQPEPVLQYIPQPEPTQEIVQAQKPVVLAERDPVPFPEPAPKPVSAPQLTSLTRSINVPQSPTPVALPPLLPKPQADRNPDFGRYLQPSVPPMIYYPTVTTATYPTQTASYSYPPTPPRIVATQAPPVVVTAQPHPAVTQAPGQLKFDFQCKEGNGYYSVEHECDTYIECKQNRAMKYACPDGLHFNPAAKHYEYPCAYPSEVKCMAGDQEQNPNPTDKCPNQYGFYSMNDGDCSKFIMCQEGLATIMNCPMGLAFNPRTSSCDWPANVPQCNPNVFKDFTCPDPPEDEDGQVSDIIYKYRYEKQCKLYVACQLGHPRLLSCERGLSFDDTSQACIDEDYVTNCSVPDLEHLQ